MRTLADWRLLSYLLTLLTVAFGVRWAWEERANMKRWMALGTAAFTVAMAVSLSITFEGPSSDVSLELASGATLSRDRLPADPTTGQTDEAIPTDVQGAVEARTDYEQIVACEEALEQIATTLRSVGAPTPVPTDDEVLASSDPDRRLASCEIRLAAIAATLPGDR